MVGRISRRTEIEALGGDFCDLGFEQESAARSRAFPQLCGPRFVEPELTHHLIAHHELLRLAGRGQRKFRNESDMTRDLEMRNFVLAKATKFLSCGGLTCLEDDESADLFAQALIGNP